MSPNVRSLLLACLVLLFLFSALDLSGTSRSAIAQAPTPTPSPLTNLQPITTTNADQLEQLAQLGDGVLYDVAWSPNGSTIAVAGSLGVWLYDATHLDPPPRLLAGHNNPVTQVRFSPDGNILASSDWGLLNYDMTVRVWDVATEESVFSEVGSGRIAFSPDGGFLVADALPDFNLRVWDTDTGLEVFNVPRAKQGWLWDAAFSPDGNTLIGVYHSYRWAYDDAVMAWDTTTWELLYEIVVPELPAGMGRVEFTGEGGQFLTWNYFNDMTYWWDAFTGELVQTVPADQVINPEEQQVRETLTAIGEEPGHTVIFSFNPDGTHFVYIEGNTRLQVCDVETNNCELIHIFDDFRGQIALNPTDHYLVVDQEWQGITKLVDVARMIAIDALPGGISFWGPDGHLLTIDRHGDTAEIRWWHIDPAEAISSWQMPFAVEQAALSPDGTILTTTHLQRGDESFSQGTIIRQWDAVSGEQINQWSTPIDLAEMEYSPDGVLIAATGQGNNAIWDAASGVELAFGLLKNS